jgi:uncharacterized protein (DUF488 family)
MSQSDDRLDGKRGHAMSIFFTIGHSTRSIDEFVQMLRCVGIETVVDVRTIPRSRTNPQFNKDTLPTTLDHFEIGYVHLPELGGLRTAQKRESPSPNTFWDNKSFRNYADYATSRSFQSGLKKLEDLGETCRCAIMCAEAVWWRCHRRIITDYLIFAGEQVFHLLAPGRVEQAHATPAARQIAPGTLVYRK